MSAPFDFKAFLMDEWNRMRDTERLDWLDKDSNYQSLRDYKRVNFSSLRQVIDSAMEREEINE